MEINKLNDNVKVLMVDPWVGNDYSVFLCTNLKNEGVNVSLIVNEDRQLPETVFSLIKILPSKQKSLSKFGKLQRYVSYLKDLYKLSQKDYKIVHFQAFRRKRMEALFFWLLSLKKVNLVFTVHDVDPLDHNIIDGFLNRVIYKSASLLVAHSETNKNLLKNKYKVNGDKVTVVPHGSFENSYPQNTLSGSESRKKLSLNEQDNVLLAFGAVKEYKGIDLLIDAASEASESVKNLVLVIAGRAEDEGLEQDYLKRIEKIKSPLRVLPHFKFIDKQDVPLYFDAADIAVLPYKIISHSGVLHLAYSYGKPVIASRTGDFEEFVKEGETGFLFNTNDKKDLTDTIIKAFRSKEKLKQMGECSKLMNREKFSWSTSAQRLKKVYEVLNKQQVG